MPSPPSSPAPFLREYAVVTYRSFEVAAGQTTTHNFPASYQAYWLRTVAESPATATAQLTYD